MSANHSIFFKTLKNREKIKVSQIFFTHCAHMGRTFKSRCEIGVDASKFDRTRIDMWRYLAMGGLWNDLLHVKKVLKKKSFPFMLLALFQNFRKFLYRQLQRSRFLRWAGILVLSQVRTRGELESFIHLVTWRH